MSENIRETIKNNMLDQIKLASTEEDRYKATYNFHTFVSALHVEASIPQARKE